MQEEWRIKVDFDDPEHGYGLGERLRSLGAEDEARRNLDRDTIVTRDGAVLFIYVGSEEQAERAEAVARELMGDEQLTGTIATERWHEVEGAWKDASEPLPETEEQRSAEAERAKRRAEREAEEGHPRWDVRVDLPSVGDVGALADKLADEGLHVRRRFRALFVGAATEEQAAELGRRIEAEAPEGTDVHVEPTEGKPAPLVFLEAHKPGIARDLGL